MLAGKASIVTDTIERFTAGGIRLASGRELPMRYQGVDVAAAMKRFVEAYHFEGRHLHGADLALFCESWRDRNGIGSAPLPR